MGYNMGEKATWGIMWEKMLHRGYNVGEKATWGTTWEKGYMGYNKGENAT